MDLLNPHTNEQPPSQIDPAAEFIRLADWRDMADCINATCDHGWSEVLRLLREEWDQQRPPSGGRLPGQGPSSA